MAIRTLRLERQQRLPHVVRKAALDALRPCVLLGDGGGLRRQRRELLVDEGVIEGALEGNPNRALALRHDLAAAVTRQRLDITGAARTNEGVVEGGGVVDGALALHVVHDARRRRAQTVHLVVQIHQQEVQRVLRRVPVKKRCGNHSRICQTAGTC